MELRSSGCGESSAAPVERGIAHVNGTGLYYEVVGSGPTIVLISGGGTLDRRMWEMQVEPFSKRYRVVRYDVRGIGQSAQPDTFFSHSDDLAALIEFVGGGPADVVGLSFAAGVALDLAVDHPEAVKRLILVAPGLSSDREKNLEGALALAELARQHGLPSIVDQLVSHPSVMAAASVETRAFVRTIYLDNANVFASDFALVRLWKPPDRALHGLGSIEVPTLVMVGDRDTAIVRETGETLANTIVGAELHVVADAAHLLHLDAPAIFNETVLAFLAHTG